MTTPEHHAYLGARLDLPNLRGEVTNVAVEITESLEDGASSREVACSWITATLEEAAQVLRATLDTSPDERAQVVVDLQNAADVLFDTEIGRGDDDG